MTSTLETNKLLSEKNAQIMKYKTKMNDLIIAYKNLQNEKKNLEELITTLTNPSNTNEENDNTNKNTEEEINVINKNNYNSINNTSSGTEAKIQSLLNSLQKMSIEKKKNEEIYENDKKSLIKKFNEEREEFENEIKSKNIIITQLKDKNKSLEVSGTNLEVRLDQLQGSNIENLKELREKWKNERIICKSLEKRVKEEQERVVEARKDLESFRKQSSVNNVNVNDIIQKYKGKIENLNKTITLKDKTISSLEEELEGLHKQFLSKEQSFQQQINDLLLERRQLNDFLRNGEGNFEDETSEMLKSLKIKDNEVDSLRQRILDLQNNAKSKDSTNNHSTSSNIVSSLGIDLLKEINEAKPQVQLKNLVSLCFTVKARIFDLKQELLTLAPLSFCEEELLHSIEELFSQHFKSHCCEQLHELESDYELYKVKMELLLKESLSSQDKFNFSIAPCKTVNENERYITALKRIGELEEYIGSLQHENNRFESKVKGIQHEIELQHECNIAKIEQGFRAEIAVLNHELISLKSRSNLMLEEREIEINRLKLSQKSGKDNNSLNNDQDDSNTVLWGELPSSSSKRCRLLHCAEEKSRKSSHIDKLTGEKKALREEIEQLRDEIYGLKSAATASHKKLLLTMNNDTAFMAGDNSNGEYMRNVIFQFLMSQDNEAKISMIKVISLLMNFDKQQVKKLKAIYPH